MFYHDCPGNCRQAAEDLQSTEAPHVPELQADGQERGRLMGGVLRNFPQLAIQYSSFDLL